MDNGSDDEKWEDFFGEFMLSVDGDQSKIQFNDRPNV